MIRHILFHGLVILAILVLSISPLLSAMAAGTIAGHYGCDLDEGSIHPCLVNGEDIGDTLYTLGVLGWLALGTIPLGLIAIGVYLAAVAIFYLVRWLLRRKRVSGETAP
jgi:hypothetical protein